MNKCSDYEELFLAYIIDDLEPNEKEAVELHIKNCSKCNEELNIKKELLEILSEVQYQPITTEKCFDTEDLVKYAFNEMNKEEMASVDKHILTCNDCLSVINDLRNAEKEIPDKPIYRLPPRSYYSSKYHCLVEDRVQKVSLYSSAAHSGETSSKPKSVEGIYSQIIVSPSEEGKIRLIDPNECPGELSEIKETIHGEDFYYRIFGIYDSGRIEQKESSSQMWLPIEIEITDTDYLMVLISQNKNILEKESGRFLKILEGKAEEKLESIICIFVKIKRD